MLKEFFQKLGGPQQDLARLFGRFSISIYDVKSGSPRLIRRIQKKNQIVNDGRRAMLELLCQVDLGSSAPEENQIWSLSVGTVGTPPTITDTGLYTPVWSEAFAVGECVISPLNFEIQIYKTLPTTPCTANGHILQEAGVFTRGDNDDPSIAANRRLYARQTHPPVEKTDSMYIVYDWRLGITVEGA